MSILHLEGKPDMVLALCLGFSRKQVRSHGPKGEVCNYLEKTRSMIGLIDEDPTSAQPDYLKRLGQLDQFEKLIRHAIQINCEPILHLQRILNS